MESQQSHRIATALAQRVDPGADARQIGDAMVSIWQDIDAALSPVLGRKAVALLYQRSLSLAASAHPWLAGVCDGAHALAPDALKAAFAQQNGATAANAGFRLLQAFHEMLASLVSPALAERLLRFVLSPDEPGAEQIRMLAEVEPSATGPAP